MRLLLTRPEPQATATATRLAAAGHSVVKAPMLLVLPTAAAIDAAGAAALAATSRTTIDVLAGRAELADLLGRPLFAVGTATAAAARALGFDRTTAAGGTVEALAAAIAATLPAGATVLHLAGRDRAGDLAAGLAPHDIAVRLAVLYRAEPAARLGDAAAAALAAERLDAGLVYSARTAAALVAAAARDGLSEMLAGLPLLALSEATAAPLRAAGARRVRVAAEPTETALLALLERPARP